MLNKIILSLFVYILIFSNAFATSKIDNVIAERVKAISTIDINYENINQQLINIENHIVGKNTNIEETNSYIKILNQIENQIEEAQQEDKNNLEFVEKRMELLGEQNDSMIEDISISNKRKEFNIEEKILKTKIAKNDLILAKINELEKLILNFRNKTLLDSILIRQNNIIGIKFISQNTKEFITFTYKIFQTPIIWYDELNNTEKIQINEDIINVILISIISIFITSIVSIFIKKYFGYCKLCTKIDYIHKTKTAITVFISNIIIPCSLILIVLIFINQNHLIKQSQFSVMFNKLLIYSVYAILLSFAVKAIFVPHHEKWRLININDKQAKYITIITIPSIILIFIIRFFEYLAIEFKYPLNLVAYIKMSSCLIKVFCIIMIAKIFFTDNIDRNSNLEDNEDIQMDNKTKVKFILYLFSIIAFFICFSGYINLAYYILNKSIISIILIGITYIINNLINVFLHRILLLKFWTKKLKINKKQLLKFNTFLTLLINPIIILILVFVLLDLWGFSTDVLIQNIKRFLIGFYIGDVKISIISICLAIISFIVSLSLFKIIKTKLLVNALSNTDIDAGVKDSLIAGFGFFGFLISIFFAIAVAGGNFSNLAIIAGALSFGIGLGLQNIVNNLVSGILILFERPIKIGDIVNINGQEGTVRQINIRSTQLETSTKSNIIIPNSNIISGIVLNKTLNNKQVRVDLNFLLDYMNDPKQIMDLLLDIANDNKKIMQKPSPYVAFNSFANNNLDFTLRFYISDINNQQDIVNEILLSTFYKFNERNIILQRQTIRIENIN